MTDATADALGFPLAPPFPAGVLPDPLIESSANLAAPTHATAVSPLQPFLHTLSHELRNVMGTIAVSVEVLGSGAGGEAASSSALNILTRQTARLEGVMGTALALARALEGDTLLSLQRVQLGGLVAQVLDELAAHGPRLALAEPPVAWIEADPVYLAQALRGLVVATLLRREDAATEGWIAIAATGADWVLRCTATAAELEAPWTPSATPVVPEVLRGIGLGGLLAQQLVRLHGGRVELSARRGGGFTLVLPHAPEA